MTRRTFLAASIAGGAVSALPGKLAQAAKPARAPDFEISTGGGGVVFLPRGIYRICGQLTLPRKTVLRGERREVAWLFVPKGVPQFNTVPSIEGAIPPGGNYVRQVGVRRSIFASVDRGGQLFRDVGAAPINPAL
jgi:hypothetical protein